MVILITIIVLLVIGVMTVRRGHVLMAATSMVLLGIVMAGADSPLAEVARGAANGLIEGGTTFVTSIGDALGGK